MSHLFHNKDSISSRRLSSERGMALVELMAAMVIGAVLIVLVLQFFVGQSKSLIRSRDTAEMQQELRWAINYVGDRLKLAGNGVPPTCGWPVVENTDGVDDPDSVSVLGSYKSLVMTTTQTMANEGSQVKVDDTDGLEIGDLCVISDGTWQEIFLATDVKDMHIWHDEFPPWNDSMKLDHRYVEGSSLTVVTYYCFFVEVDEEGRSNLMVQTQAYEPQILLGDVDDFQIRFQMKNNEWINEPRADELYDIRMIEIAIRARSHNEIKGYTDPEFGDSYQRLEVTSQIIPKNLTIL